MHLAEKFQYLVHGIRPYEHLDPQALITYFQNKAAIPMSLIFNNYRETFYNVGFILDVPPENIVAARPRSISTGILKDEALYTEFRETVNEANNLWGVFSPEDLIKYSKLKKNTQNEVYAITGYKYSNLPKVKINGVFLKRDSGRKISQLAQTLGSNLSVPIITI